MELKSDLSRVRAGDWTLSIFNGWKKVKAVCGGKVVLDDDDWFFLDGRYGETDTYPTCFSADQVPECFLEIYGPPPVEFRDGEPVWVSSKGNHWYPRIFKAVRESDHLFIVYGKDGEDIPWKYCRKWSP